MKLSVPTLLFAAVWVGGCATKHDPAFQPLPGSFGPGTSAGAPAITPTGSQTNGQTNAQFPLIVTPEVTLTGRVAAYNEAGRFVVLDFPIGHLPANEQVMFVYRQGLKMGEVKVNGLPLDHNIVADLVSGEARKGDEVRDR